MREIKFRYWNGEKMEMVGDLSFFENGGLHINQEYIEGSKLMQYTGLKDRNGVEIYEGDIVHIEPLGKTPQWQNWSTNEHKPIIFDGGAFRFDGMNIAEMMGYGGFPYSISYEVIGNIHQNAELLDTNKDA